MKQESPRFTRAALLCAAALISTSALAQESAAPPVAPVEAPVAPPRVVPTVGQNGPAGGTSATPVNAEAAAQAAAESAQRRPARAEARRPARAPARAAPAAAPAVRAAPVAAAPAAALAPATEPAPVETAPVAAAPEAAAPPVAQVSNTTTETTTEATPGSSDSLPWWPLILVAGLIAAGIAFLVMRRRGRNEAEVWDEPVHTQAVAEPAPMMAAPIKPAAPFAATPALAPVAPRPLVAAVAPAATPTMESLAADPVEMAPALADDASVATADSAEVAALTAATMTGNRPWLELAMRPIRAGTNVDEALVEIELTVGNAGNAQAEDVRISTFMLPAGSDSEMDRLLTQSRVDAAVEPMTIAAGEGTRVDATLALPRSELMANDATHFQPVIVADARYRLPDGSEGRTSASFLVGGTAEDGSMEALVLDRPLLREDVEARLYREPARV